MEIKTKAVFTREHIAYALTDYIRKCGYEVYVGTFRWEWKDGEFKHIECDIFEEKTQ